MPWITETIWPAVLIGLVVELVLTVMVVASGRGRLVWAMIGVLAVALGLVAIERLVVTEREEVALALDAVAVALTKNDLPLVLTYVATSAPHTRAAAQANLGRVAIHAARVGSDLKVDVRSEAQPPTATARFVAQFSGVEKSSQTRFDKFVQRLEIHLVKEDGQWRIAAYKLLPIVGGQNRREM